MPSNPTWNGMSQDEKKAYLRAASERRHRLECEEALQVAGTTGPALEELSDDQRERVRQENRLEACAPGIQFR